MPQTITPAVTTPTAPPPPCSPAALAPTVRQLAEASIAKNTRVAYAAALRQFAAAKLVLSAVKFRAELNGQPTPRDPRTNQQMKGFQRNNAGRGRGQVAGLTWEQADTVAAQAANGGDNLAGLRDAAIVAVMSDALLRVSECAALDVADIDQTESTVTIQRSKTDQEGEGAVLYLGAPTVERVRAWVEAAGIEDGPLFRALTKSHGLRGRITA